MFCCLVDMYCELVVLVDIWHMLLLLCSLFDSIEFMYLQKLVDHVFKYGISLLVMWIINCRFITHAFIKNISF